MPQPVISTITPCYRAGKYLPGFLEWLPAQTCLDRLEVVLDHNEPTSDEVGLVRAFQRRHPGVIKHIIVDKVDPISVSMNRCIRSASADLLAIWNVDDLRTPDSLEGQANLLVRRAEIGLVYGNYTRVKSFTATKGELVRHEALTHAQMRRSMYVGPFFMFRRSLLDRAGHFDEQLRSGADYDLALRLLAHAREAMVEGSLGYYLNEGLGASTRPGALQPTERVVVDLRYGIYERINYDFFPKAMDYDIRHLWYQGRRIHVREYLPADADVLTDVNWRLLEGFLRYAYWRLRRRTRRA
jgi:glycosyltransferase involved in cell wall biosynthesis